MTLTRLVLCEIEKLVRSTVFMLAPIALIFFLGLMLFGFEVYAAKNGNPSTEETEVSQISERAKPSIIVSAYSVIHKMAGNILNLFISPSAYGLSGYEPNLEIKPGEVEEFNFFRTFYDGLFNPKSMPRPKNECPCNCEEEREGTFDISLSFLGTAYAAEVFKIKEKPQGKPSDTFMMKLKDRLEWLMEAEDLSHRVIDRERFNGMRFTYLSLYFAFVFVFPLIILSVTSSMFAGEFESGTVRTFLLRAVKRSDFLLAKYIVLVGYISLLILFFVVLSIIVGVTFAGYGDLFIASDLVGMEGSRRVIFADGALLLFLLTVPIGTLAFLPLAALGVFLSYIKPESSFVVGTTATIYFILITLGALPIFEDMNFLFFTSYMDVWLLPFQGKIPVASFINKIVALILMSSGFFLLVDHRFQKKDIYE